MKTRPLHWRLGQGGCQDEFSFFPVMFPKQRSHVLLDRIMHGEVHQNFSTARLIAQCNLSLNHLFSSAKLIRCSVSYILSIYSLDSTLLALFTQDKLGKLLHLHVDFCLLIRVCTVCTGLASQSFHDLVAVPGGFDPLAKARGRQLNGTTFFITVVIIYSQSFSTTTI